MITVDYDNYAHVNLKKYDNSISNKYHKTPVIRRNSLRPFELNNRNDDRYRGSLKTVNSSEIIKNIESKPYAIRRSRQSLNTKLHNSNVRVKFNNSVERVSFNSINFEHENDTQKEQDDEINFKKATDVDLDVVNKGKLKQIL